MNQSKGFTATWLSRAVSRGNVLPGGPGVNFFLSFSVASKLCQASTSDWTEIAELDIRDVARLAYVVFRIRSSAP